MTTPTDLTPDPAPADDATDDDLTGTGPLDAAGTRRLRQEASRRRVEARDLRSQLDALTAREARRDRADVLALAREAGLIDVEDAFTLQVVTLDALPRTEDGDVDADAVRETLSAVKRTRPYLFDGYRPAPLPGQGASSGGKVLDPPASAASWSDALRPTHG